MESHAKTWKLELHSFESFTLSDAQFLTGSRAGVPVTLTAALRMPTPGFSRMPAVVLLHGSGGASGYVDDWARALNCLGIATLLVDSFTGRGIETTFMNQDALGRLAMIVDAYRAHELLARHPRIDASRIALMGFSRGGQAALYAAVSRFRRMHAQKTADYAAHIAFYPACHTRFLDDERVESLPIHVLHGTEDDLNPIEPCREYVARVRAAGGDIQLHEFAGARHIFDWPMLARPMVLQGARSHKGVLLEEKTRGELVEQDTGLPAAQSRERFTLNPTIAYDAPSLERARTIVRGIVQDVLLSPINA
jgi:dienelactone hydrolase